MVLRVGDGRGAKQQRDQDSCPGRSGYGQVEHHQEVRRERGRRSESTDRPATRRVWCAASARVAHGRDDGRRLRPTSNSGGVPSLRGRGGASDARVRPRARSLVSVVLVDHRGRLGTLLSPRAHTRALSHRSRALPPPPRGAAADTRAVLLCRLVLHARVVCTRVASVCTRSPRRTRRRDCCVDTHRPPPTLCLRAPPAVSSGGGRGAVVARTSNGRGGGGGGVDFEWSRWRQRGFRTVVVAAAVAWTRNPCVATWDVTCDDDDAKGTCTTSSRRTTRARSASTLRSRS